MSPETGQKKFLKAQITVSEVVGRQRFNTAVFCTPVTYTKREPRAAIFWKEQFKDLKEDLKTEYYFFPRGHGNESCNLIGS